MRVKKSVGKPDAGNPHVRFDERGTETRRTLLWFCTRAVPRLYHIFLRLIRKKMFALVSDLTYLMDLFID